MPCDASAVKDISVFPSVKHWCFVKMTMNDNEIFAPGLFSFFAKVHPEV